MKIISAIVLGILNISLLTGCATPDTATITGTVTYREDIELPPNAIVTVKVEDVSRADAPAVTIGQQVIENLSRQLPIPFEIEYDPRAIDERYTYAMRVRIEVNGELWFINTSRYQVITHDYPTHEVEVVVEKVGPRETQTLEDTRWVLQSYGKPGNQRAVIAGKEITVEFAKTEGSVKGSAGCNSYFGSYELQGSQVSIPGPIAVTEMFCMEPEGVMDQEQKFLTVLQLAESYVFDGGKLQINCGSQVLIFKGG